MPSTSKQSWPSHEVGMNSLFPPPTSQHRIQLQDVWMNVSTVQLLLYTSTTVKYRHWSTQEAKYLLLVRHSNKQYFKSTPTLPVNEFYITTANRTRERVKQQIFANITCGNVQYELPMLVVNKLVRHCILGIDALNKMKAVINTADQTMTCTLNNVCLLYTSRCV